MIYLPLILIILSIVWTIKPVIEKRRLLTSYQTRKEQLTKQLEALEDKKEKVATKLEKWVQSFNYDPMNSIGRIISVPIPITLKDQPTSPSWKDLIEYFTEIEKSIIENQRIVKVTVFEREYDILSQQIESIDKRIDAKLSQIERLESDINTVRKESFLQSLGVARTIILTNLSILLVIMVREEIIWNLNHLNTHLLLKYLLR